ncbi:hypothetical protein VDGD_21340 [Verticillium dahliae]|nr:hypothetical protein VDGD_21340 [Verticillium dahliae]
MASGRGIIANDCSSVGHGRNSFETGRCEGAFGPGFGCRLSANVVDLAYQHPQDTAQPAIADCALARPARIVVDLVQARPIPRLDKVGVCRLGGDAHAQLLQILVRVTDGNSELVKIGELINVED